MTRAAPPELGPRQQQVVTVLRAAGGALVAGVLADRTPGTHRQVLRALVGLAAAGIVDVQREAERLRAGDLVRLLHPGLDAAD